MSYSRFKSLLDFFIALLSIFLLSPVFFIVYLLIFIRLGTPVLFRQPRVGLNGNTFTMYKFRTMTNSCDVNGSLLPDSQRLTPFGVWLRSTSIDELPELFNILRGEMSFIGPRPLLIQYLPLYSERQSRRHLVRPGVSGWAQINGRNSISWERKLSLDVWYVENCNLFLDLRILIMTFLHVILRKGITTKGGGLMPVFKGTNIPSDSHD